MCLQIVKTIYTQQRSKSINIDEIRTRPPTDMNLLQWVIPWSHIVGEVISSIKRVSRFLKSKLQKYRLKNPYAFLLHYLIIEGGSGEMQFSFQKNYRCCQKPSYLKNFVLLWNDWFIIWNWLCPLFGKIGCINYTHQN